MENRDINIVKAELATVEVKCENLKVTYTESLVKMRTYVNEVLKTKLGKILNQEITTFQYSSSIYAFSHYEVTANNLRIETSNRDIEVSSYGTNFKADKDVNFDEHCGYYLNLAEAIKAVKTNKDEIVDTVINFFNSEEFLSLNQSVKVNTNKFENYLNIKDKLLTELETLERQELFNNLIKTGNKLELNSMGKLFYFEVGKITDKTVENVYSGKKFKVDELFAKIRYYKLVDKFSFEV